MQTGYKLYTENTTIGDEDITDKSRRLQPAREVSAAVHVTAPAAVGLHRFVTLFYAIQEEWSEYVERLEHSFMGSTQTKGLHAVGRTCITSSRR